MQSKKKEKCSFFSIYFFTYKYSLFVLFSHSSEEVLWDESCGTKTSFLPLKLVCKPFVSRLVCDRTGVSHNRETLSSQICKPIRSPRITRGRWQKPEASPPQVLTMDPHFGFTDASLLLSQHPLVPILPLLFGNICHQKAVRVLPSGKSQRWPHFIRTCLRSCLKITVDTLRRGRKHAGAPRPHSVQLLPQAVSSRQLYSVARL